ncbi:MAG TPA: SRPBCC family protein [Gemmatimonadota bacterium]|nr:SRPBCC family protein [Gemmatimonadota bacterium]
MAITIQKTFDVEQPPEDVWAFLVDPERVVDCLPGAKLLEEVDERTYRGEMGMKLGPIGVTFTGTIRFDRLDEEALEVEMSGEGKDEKGSGSVKMHMESRLEPLDDGGTRVSVAQSINLSGRLASFGRGGIVQNVADFMFGRFTSCVTKKLAEG